MIDRLVPMEEEFSLSHLTVLELQQECKKRGLKKNGSKAKLIQRLAEYIEKYGRDHIEPFEKVNQVVESPVEKSVMAIHDPHPYMEEYEEQLIESVNNETGTEGDVDNFFRPNRSAISEPVEEHRDNDDVPSHVEHAIKPTNDSPDENEIPDSLAPAEERDDLLQYDETIDGDESEMPDSPTYPATGNSYTELKDLSDDEPIHGSPTYPASPRERIIELPENRKKIDLEGDESAEAGDIDKKGDYDDNSNLQSFSDEEHTDNLENDVKEALHAEENSKGAKENGEGEKEEKSEEREDQEHEDVEHEDVEHDDHEDVVERDNVVERDVVERDDVLEPADVLERDDIVEHDDVERDDVEHDDVERDDVEHDVERDDVECDDIEHEDEANKDEEVTEYQDEDDKDEELNEEEDIRKVRDDFQEDEDHFEEALLSELEDARKEREGFDQNEECNGEEVSMIEENGIHKTEEVENNVQKEIENVEVNENEQDVSYDDQEGDDSIGAENLDLHDEAVNSGVEDEDAQELEEGEITVSIENQNDDHLDISVQGEKIEDQEIPVKPVKKIVPPVPLKKRISLLTTENSEERAAKRKRRWGSTLTSTKDSSFPISAESIKKLIPDLKIDNTVIDNISELDYQEDEVIENAEVIEDVAEVEVVADGASPPKIFKGGRSVKVQSEKKITLEKPTSTVPDIVNIESDTGEIMTPTTPVVVPKPPTQPSIIEEDVEVEEHREKSPSPAQNPSSQYIHIENLVRPYTISQLKAVISRTGHICDGGFWINNIKSQCYVKLSTELEAGATREALHGLRWPAGSPKLLKIDFAINKQMYKETTGLLGEKAKIVIEIEDKDADSVILTEERVHASSRTEEPHDLTQRNEAKKRSLPKEQHQKTKKKEKKESQPREEGLVKLLDDLFLKTKATPCIYWLPLTEEQILKKESKSQRK